MISIKINGQIKELDVDPSTPLLWVVRENIELTGSKFGCGLGLCGACTMHMDGVPIRSCITPIAAVGDKEITTIEGIGNLKDGLHPVQQAWIDEQVPQCGYCQSGQIMTAIALLKSNASPSDEEIDKAMNGNICRCGTYGRIKKGIKKASELAIINNLKISENG